MENNNIGMVVAIAIMSACCIWTISQTNSYRDTRDLVQQRADSLQWLIDTYESYYDYPFDLLVGDYIRMDKAMEEGMSWCDALQFLPRNERFKWSEGCIQTVHDDHMVLFDGTPFYFLTYIQDNEIN